MVIAHTKVVISGQHARKDANRAKTILNRLQKFSSESSEISTVSVVKKVCDEE